MWSLRLPLAVAFILAALLSLVNVTAYQQATVTNSFHVTVTTPDSAALALSTTHPMAQFLGQALDIDFTDGYSSSVFALQTSLSSPTTITDTVTMKNLFSVTNLSANDVCMTVYVDGTAPAVLSGIVGNVGGRSRTLTSGSGLLVYKTEVMDVDFRWTGTGSARTGGTFTLKIQGDKYDGSNCLP